MSLTLSRAPLSTDRPAEVNFELTGPDRLLLFDIFPRRVRAVFAGETLIDTTRGRLLHESGLLPELYVPGSDIRDDMLQATEHTAHSPSKGDAAYWSVRSGDLVAEDAVCAYPEPPSGARWLLGYKTVSWPAMQAGVHRSARRRPPRRVVA